MRKTLLIALFSLSFITLPLFAQSWAKKASKSVFVLKTFKADGSLNGSANGFFIDPDGSAVSCYAPFKGASSAVVIDSEGKEHPVTFMLGANETYDVAKFRVEAKKVQALSLSTSESVGTDVWLLSYRNQKNLSQGRIRKAEQFMGDYNYYTVALQMQDDKTGCPLMNSNGQVVGLMQQPARVNDTLCYAVSARFADSLRMTGLSLNDPALKAVNIKKAVPSELNQALLMLYVASGSLDSLAFSSLIDDFIEQYPSAPEGYQYRAQQAYGGNDFATAQRNMETAIRVADKKDDAHYEYSKLIYKKEVYNNKLPYEPWSLDLALSEAVEAYRIEPLPVYRRQQAVVLFAKNDYRQADSIYQELTQSSLRSAELFYEASTCRTAMGDSIGGLALLDSAVASFGQPYLKEAAPYLLIRAQYRMRLGDYRGAVTDLSDYESLMPMQVNEQFYYLRFQAAVSGRIYQQALNDINKALTMQPQNEVFLSEKTSFLVRVGLYKDAVETAQQLIAVSPNLSDGYLFLGLAQCLTDNKGEGVKNLQKAQELGDPQAKDLIEKYSH